MKIEDLTSRQEDVIECNGVKVRKGTIGTMMKNVALFEKNKDPSKRGQILHEIESDIGELIPSLKALDMFEFFSIIEWLEDPKREGRILVALLYLQQFPEKMSLDVQVKLNELTQCVAPDVMSIID